MLNTSAAAADPFKLDDLFAGLAEEIRVAVAVSGGSDSMALLRLATEWAEKRNVALVALTVDHALRTESAGEARLVGAWCAALGVEHHVLRWEGAKPRTGVQAAARTARYDLLQAWCKAHDVPVVLTGHTRDDQAETVAMRRSRTSSSKSLSAIWPETQWKGLRVVRPLLGQRRTDLRSMLHDAGQGWIDDPSNDDLRFERVRVRNALSEADVPALADAALNAQERHTDALLRAKAFWQANVRVDRLGFVVVPRAAFAGLAVDVAAEVLARAVYVAGNGVRPDRNGIAGLVGWITGGRGRRTLAGALVALRKREILVSREAGRIAKAWVQIAPGVLWDGRFELVVPTASEVGPAELAKGLKRPANVPDFVWKGLPVVKMAAGGAILALEGGESGISTMFRERIWF